MADINREQVVDFLSNMPVIQLAVACGLLMPVDGEPGFFQLDPDWFSDPVNKTGEGLSNNAPTCAAAATSPIFFGGVCKA